METVVCNLCGSGNLIYRYSMPDKHFYPDEFFSVVECENCGLAFVNPRPTRVEIGKYYPETFYEDFHTQEERYRAEISFLKELYAGFDSSVCAWARGRFLDVGTANGDFPRMMRREGWEVEGLEVSANAKAVEDFPIYNCELPDIPVSNSRYDLITAWAVFEHLHDPLAYFRKVGELLRPGGVFVFLVSNWNSVSSQYLMCEDIPRHLYFYSEHSIREYLRRSKLAFIRHDTNGKIYSVTPENYVPWLVHRLLGKDFKWENIPENRRQFVLRKKLSPGIRANITFAMRHPFVVLDRLLSPLVISHQIRTKTFGTSIYVAQKIEGTC